jgi:Holliday junction resolvase
MNESSLTSQFNKTLRDSGCYVVKHVASGMTYVGVPDVLVCSKGRFIGCEMKIMRGSKLAYTDPQKVNLQLIRNAGGLGVGIAIDITQPPASRWAVDCIVNGETAHLEWCSLAGVVLKLLT